MSALAKKLAAAKQKRLEILREQKDTSAEPSLSASDKLLAQTTTPSSAPINSLDSISLKLSEQNSEVQKHLEKREAEGIYKFNDKIKDIEGLDVDTLLDKMKALDTATVEKTPEIRTLSMEIRRNLHQYPELTHLLTDDQLGIIVSGVLVIAGVETEPKTKQGKAAQDKKVIQELGQMPIDDLGF